MSFTSAARHDLYRAVGARAASLFGDQVATFALVLQVRSAGSWAVAAVLMANLVPIVALSGVAGRLTDRVDNRRVLAAAGTGQLAVCLALAAASSTPVCIALIGVLGVGQAVTGAAWQALLPSLVAPEHLGRALGAVQAGSALALVAAPGSAGVLVSALGTHLPLVVDALTFAVLALVARSLSTGRVHEQATHPTTPDGGWSIVARTPMLRAVVTLLGSAVLLGCMVNVAEVFLVRDVLHADVVWFGIAGTVYAVGMLAGAVLAGRLRDHRRPFVAAMLGLGVGLALMGLAPGVGWLLAAGVLTGACNGVANVGSAALIAAAAPEAVRGRVAAVLGGVIAAAQLVAYAAGGVLDAHVGPRAVFVLAGVAGAAAPLVLGRAVLRPAVSRTGASPMRSPVDTRHVPRSVLHRPGSSTAPELRSAEPGRLGACASASITSSRGSAASPPVRGS